jgi:hypothetical protein
VKKKHYLTVIIIILLIAYPAFASTQDTDISSLINMIISFFNYIAGLFSQQSASAPTGGSGGGGGGGGSPATPSPTPTSPALPPTPSPTPTSCDSTCKTQRFTSGTCRTGPPDINLAPMPGNWRPGGYGGGTKTLFLDNSMLSPKGNPSWRVEAYTDGNEGTPPSQRVGNYWRECISQDIPIDYKTNPLKVGDYIVAKIWIRTGHSTIGKDGVVPSSVVMVWDYRNDIVGQVREHNSNVMEGTEYACDVDPNFNCAKDDTSVFVPMDTIDLYPQANGWVERTLTGRVPSQILNYQGTAWSTTMPTFLIVAANAGSYQFWNSTSNMAYQDEGLVWFSDAEVYINPTCQSNETSIGQGSCSSGQNCCCA